MDDGSRIKLTVSIDEKEVCVIGKSKQKMVKTGWQWNCSYTSHTKQDTWKNVIQMERNMNKNISSWNMSLVLNRTVVDRVYRIRFRNLSHPQKVFTMVLFTEPHIFHRLHVQLWNIPQLQTFQARLKLNSWSAPGRIDHVIIQYIAQ